MLILRLFFLSLITISFRRLLLRLFVFETICGFFNIFTHIHNFVEVHIRIMASIIIEFSPQSLFKTTIAV